MRRLSTPRAAGLAGVLFAVLFGVAIALIHTALPEGAQPGAQWVEGSEGKVRAAAVLMPFAGICFLCDFDCGFESRLIANSGVAEGSR